MINSRGFEENLYTKGCIRTFTGIYVDVLNPKLEQFCIEDIAHSLSQYPRFGGHLPRFYSVAEHSINCCYAVRNEGETRENIFSALMHDCSEAYLGDITNPVKSELKEYKDLEEKYMRLLSEKFGFYYSELTGLSNYIKQIDKQFLEFEFENFFLKELNSKRDMEEVESEFLSLYNIYKP